MPGIKTEITPSGKEKIMKVLGLTCGRKMSNTEILIKEALMGAEEMGAEVEIVRLLDFNIKPCTGCNSCVIDLFEKAGSGECIIKNIHHI